MMKISGAARDKILFASAFHFIPIDHLIILTIYDFNNVVTCYLRNRHNAIYYDDKIIRIKLKICFKMNFVYAILVFDRHYPGRAVAGDQQYLMTNHSHCK